MTASKTNIDESKLVISLKDQDKNALAYLYDQYSAALYGVIFRIVKRETLAEEVLQETFVKIWNSIDQYSAKEGRLFTWMFRLARNLAIDKSRSKGLKRELKTDAVADHMRYCDHKDNQQQQTNTVALERLLSKLQPEQALIINLLYLKGYTHAEVVQEFEIPLETVKAWHRWAMINLRELLVKEV